MLSGETNSIILQTEEGTTFLLDLKYGPRSVISTLEKRHFLWTDLSVPLELEEL
jgi:hypothetical protein